MKMSRTACLLVLATLLCLAMATDAEAVTGEPIPPVTLQDLEGKPVSLSDFRGRPVLVHFWATWCPACVLEMPMVEEIARTQGGKTVVLGVNLGERKKVVATYVKEKGLTFPILLDARGKAAAAFGVTALPATVLIGPTGSVSKVIPMGSLDVGEIERLLK